MTTAAYATDLRRELAQRAYTYAERRGLPYFLSLGSSPAVIFQPSEDGLSHGNFIDASYKAIVGNPAWAKRLAKTHTSRRSLPVEHRDGIRELDSSNSSDALLMNVMCYPGVLDSDVRGLLGIRRDADVRFGHRARVPFHSKADSTELDMMASGLIVEAKLTEHDFGAKPIEKLERYRDLRVAFSVGELPTRRAPVKTAIDDDGEGSGACNVPLLDGYQLVRNVLAAHELGVRFRLIYDERRPDLAEYLYRVLRAVRDGELRSRCGEVTWQEIARRAPRPLAAFLEEKYGIA